MSSEYDVWFTEDAREFLERAGAHLAQDPVTGTVVTTTAQRFAADGPVDLPYAWFATVTGPTGAIEGVAMRTAHFRPHPPYLLAMSDNAARAFAQVLVARGEEMDGINGLRPATDLVAGILAEQQGREVRTSMHSRLFELGTLVEPKPVQGHLRPVRADEGELALDWIHEFFFDANEQAGRARTDGFDAHYFTREDVARKLDEDVLRFWVDDDDRPLHLTGWNPPAYGVVRVGPVYTPKEHRGRGLASAAVAQVSAELQGAGHRVVLFTDQANPTSNGVYMKLGYESVVDTIELRLSTP